MIRIKKIEKGVAEDQAKMEVRANLVIFAILCATIRFAPILIRKITS